MCIEEIVELAKQWDGMASVKLQSNPYEGDSYYCEVSWADGKILISKDYAF
jgi:hypothetical protein